MSVLASDRSNKGDDGGNVILQAGKGYVDGKVSPGQDGSIIFRLADCTEFMRIAGNGDVFIQHRRVKNDMAVYCGFKNWLRAANAIV